MRTTRHLSFALVLIVLAGCTSHYRELVSEQEVPLLRDLKQQASQYPQRTSHLPTSVADEPTVHVAVHETGRLSADRLVVLLHGCAADHETWRFVAGALGRDYPLVLVDLPGCGQSDRPAASPGAYAPDALTERVLQALAAHLADRERARITLVGHSLGGAVAMRMMGNADLRSRYRTVTQRVDRMVLLAPLDVEFPNPPPVIIEMATVGGVEIALADALGILKERVAAGVREAVCAGNRALREDADRMCATLRHQSSRRSMQEILQEARPLNGDELDWPAVKRIVSDYGNIAVPCLILWGEYDDTLPVAMGHKLAGQIPTAELQIVEDCKHSIQLEYPVLCANEIRRFSSLAGLVAAPDRGASATPVAYTESHP